MKKYKVALITNIPAPYRIPLFEKISEHPSIDLYVYFTAMSEENRKWVVEMDNKFKYKILPGFTLRYKGKDLFNYHINLSIIKELIRNDYDILIVGGYASFATQISFFLSKLRNISFILWSGSTVNEPSLLRKVSLPLAELIVKHSDAFIAYGTRAKDYLVSLGASPEKIFIAFNSGSTEFFKKRTIKAKIKNLELKNKLKIEKKKIVLYVGQLIERKGVKYLIKAYEKLKKEDDNICLLIAGDGPQKEKLLNMCQQNKIEDVKFVGFIQKDKLHFYYSVADVFVLPSIYDPFAIVLTEAMACGLPIIHTHEGGASVDAIKNGVNGYIVNAKNVGQLYEAIKKILSNQDLREKMGEESKRVIEERFTYEHMAEGFWKGIEYVFTTIRFKNS